MKKQGSYLTIASRSTGIYKEKGSKFLPFAFPVKSEHEAQTYIRELKKEYKDARHLCYAYITGQENEISRTNDGGEPHNSAGKPIHGQLLSRRLTDVLIVVVRYFGGTLLGLGGLVHAYKSAAEDALNNAHVISLQRYTLYEVRFPYEAINDVMKIIKAVKINTRRQNIGSICSMELEIPEIKEKEVIRDISFFHEIQITKMNHQHG